MIARGTPAGRSSTAQGVLGAAGTVGTIGAALGAGVLAAFDLGAPFLVGSAVLLGLLLLTVAVGGGSLRWMRPRLPDGVRPAPPGPPWVDKSPRSASI